MARPTRDYWHLSTFNQDITPMTTPNNLSPLTCDSLGLIKGHYLDNLYFSNYRDSQRLCATSRQTTSRFNRDQMQMGFNIVTNDTLSTHLHLSCKWWIFVIQKKHYQTICREKSKVTTPQSHDKVAMGQQLLTRSIGVICLSQYLQHLIWTVW